MELNVSHGVQELIDRLKTEGIQSGEQQAQKITELAQQKARTIVAEAKREAEMIRQNAVAEANRHKTSGEEAVRIAARDALLALKSKMTQLFRDELAAQVSTEFRREEFLCQLILEVCRKKIPDLAPDQTMTVILPSELIDLASLGNLETPLAHDSLSQLVLAIYGDRLRQGIEFSNGNNDNGIKVRLEGQEILVDLSDRAVSDLLTQHLLPRFRALLEGYGQ
jgi:V/A-type H+/Na+-transporting ATPase subunit E